LLRHRRCWDHIGLPRRRSMLANLLRDPQPGRAATGPPRSAPTSTHRSPPSVAGGSRRRGPRLYPRSICCCCVSFFFLVRDQVCITLPFVAALSSTLPRTRWLLHALTSCGIDARDQAIIAGVTTFSGGGAIRCHSSSSLHSIRVRAYCHFRGDTAADVAEGRRPSAFQLPRLPSPFAAHCLAAVTGKNLLSLCTRTPLLTLRTCALLHGFDHAHFDHGYLGTKGLSSA